MNTSEVYDKIREEIKEIRKDTNHTIKHDDGKSRAGCLEDFSLALTCIAQIFDAGAEEGYQEGSWAEVEPRRYKHAEWRHRLKGPYEQLDEKSGRPHKWHEIWNMLAQLELQERAKLKANTCYEITGTAINICLICGKPNEKQYSNGYDCLNCGYKHRT